jgi:hypothetical protein
MPQFLRQAVKCLHLRLRDNAFMVKTMVVSVDVSSILGQILWFQAFETSFKSTFSHVYEDVEKK